MLAKAKYMTERQSMKHIFSKIADALFVVMSIICMVLATIIMAINTVVTGIVFMVCKVTKK